MRPDYCFLALMPEGPVQEHILHAKAAVRSAVGPQRYLEDPPHTTLFVSAFEDLSSVIATLRTTLVDTPAPRVEATGWHVFTNDPLTGGNTAVCAIGGPGVTAVRDLQMQLLRLLAPWRDVRRCHDRYTANWDRLDALRQASIRDWGFPFTGSDWQPHISVCSIRLTDWAVAWPLLAERPPAGPITYGELRLYTLHGDEPALQHRQPLRMD
jgi:hypothetical protein